MREVAYRWIAAVLCAALILACAPPANAASPTVEDISAQSYALVELNTGMVLYAENAHQTLPMASTTKVMTAIIAIERCGLDEPVTVSSNAYGTEGSSIYLEQGETLTLRDMLYGLMLRSGNDAAVAIAEHVGGSVSRFIELMNQKARELGLVNTSFVTPNGLPDENHFTTAYEYALICAYAMKSSVFREIVSTEYYRAESGNYIRTMRNKNRLLWEYEGCCGIKTGYTKAAGKCLTFYAERNGLEVVGVVLNAPDMFDDAKALMDAAFSAYSAKQLLSAGEIVARIPIYGGEKYVLEVTAAQDIIIPVRVDSEGMAYVSAELPPAVEPPVQKGDVLGELTVQLEDGTRLCCDLVAGQSVEKSGYLDYIQRAAANWCA